MPSKDPLKNTLLTKLFRMGRGAANIVFPNDIEAYFLIFQLVDYELKPLRTLTFPIMPTDIIEHQPELTKATPTYGGVHVIKTDSFIPRKVVIVGMFGRRIYLVNTIHGTVKERITGLLSNVKNIVTQEEIPEFSRTFKTGYGALKSIEQLKELSKSRDDMGRQHYLYLYNPVFGSNYVVEFNVFERTQNSETSNLLYPYKIELTAVADVSSIIGIKGRAKATLRSFATNSVTAAIRNPGRTIAAIKDPKRALSVV